MNYILTSVLVHGIALGYLYSPEVNTSAAKTEVQLIYHKKGQDSKSGLLLPTSGKPLNTGRGTITSKKGKKVDLNTYALQVKAIVDPIFYAKAMPIYGGKKIYRETKLLIFVDEYGSIRGIKVLETSGDAKFDNLTVETFQEAAVLPNPPEVVIKEGIEWTLTVGG